MNIKITKRDIKFFILGIVSLFIIETTLGWNDVIKDFKKGFEVGYNKAKK